MIAGAAGQLGRELMQSVPDGVSVIAVDIAELDLTDAAAVAAHVAAHRPGVIINAAAYTAVDRAEQQPALAHAVNATAAADLALAARHNGARMIHVSTDYVFGGPASHPWRPADVTAPQSVYGRTKRDGEVAVLDRLAGGALVIRTAWLYSAHGANFVKTMLRLMRERDEVHVIADQIGTPTSARSLARTIWAAVARPEVSGILHWTDAGVASWYDFAVAIHEEARACGLLSRETAVRPITSEEYSAPARRPSYSVLDTTETTRVLGETPSHWRTNLRHMLQELVDA
jgi:dTDP-4-dehydrorhamnose reductase